MLTAQQIEWAKQHDWFSNVDQEGIVYVFDRYVDKWGKFHETLMPWTASFTELRRWAGY